MSSKVIHRLQIVKNFLALLLKMAGKSRVIHRQEMIFMANLSSKKLFLNYSSRKSP